MCGKHQSVYGELFQSVVDKCGEYSPYSDSELVVTEFEKAAIQAASSVLGKHMRTQMCFYHLCQSTYRKIQDLGLTKLYQTERDVKMFSGMCFFFFLPLDHVIVKIWRNY